MRVWFLQKLVFLDQRRKNMGIDCGLMTVNPEQAARIEGEYGSRGGLKTLERTECCNIDKTWHAIHFILTGSADEAPLPEGYLLDGGTYLGEPNPDGDTAQPRLLSPEETNAFAEVLRPIDNDEFERRFDHKAMLDADVYGIDDDEEEDFEIVSECFTELRDFILKAADARQGVMIHIG
jgi:hypothetical protein